MKYEIEYNLGIFTYKQKIENDDKLVDFLYKRSLGELVMKNSNNDIKYLINCLRDCAEYYQKNDLDKLQFIELIKIKLSNLGCNVYNIKGE